jgi:hypothetical protein
MLDLHRHHLRTQSLGGDLEAQQGARRVFKEGVEDGEAVQAAVIAAGLAVEGEPSLGLVENRGDLRVGQIVDR